MIKPLYIGIVVIVLLALGAGAAVLSNRNTVDNTSIETSVEGNAETPVNAEAPRTIKELLSYQGTQQCSFSSEGNNGLVYISQGKMRGDFTITTPQGSAQSHMIIDGQNIYIWSDTQKSGIKMSAEVINEFDTTAQSSTVDLNQNMNFSCSSWVANQALFTAPSDITFTDPSASLKVDGNAPPAISCSTCDTMPESARADCRAALCN